MRALRAVYHRSFYAVSLLAVTRTEAGGFYLLATLLFFFTKGYRADKKG